MGLRGTYRTEDGTFVLDDVIRPIDGREVSAIDDLYAAHPPRGRRHSGRVRAPFVTDPG